MAEKTLAFPKGFLWGTATAGHQIEGHNENSDWGKFEREGKIKDGSKSGRNIDYWNKYEEDHALMAELGYKAFRLGIEWTKIEPEDGRFDYEAIAHYRKILQSLKDKNIKICLTIYHWVLPLWFAEKGGWEREDAVDRFVKFAEVVIKELGEFPDLWVTLNEPNVPSLAGYLAGEFPPEKHSLLLFGKVMNRMMKAHARTYKIIHDTVSTAPGGGPVMAGIAYAYQWIEPFGSPGAAGVFEKILNGIFIFGAYKGWDNAVLTGYAATLFGRETIPMLKDSYDYCGINYYQRISLKFDASKKDQAFIDVETIPEGIERTQMGWQIYPPGFYKIMMYNWRAFKKPIYITENGIADDIDEQRPKYTLEHLAQVHRAIESGADVKGYFHWSFMDNFEWKEGFSKKFGLVAADPADPDLKRTPRKSAHMYSEIIAANAITPDLVKKYAPGAEPGVLGDKWRV